MYPTVYPRYTRFEKFLLGILYLIELPFHVFGLVAVRSRERYSRFYLDDIELERKVSGR